MRTTQRWAVLLCLVGLVVTGSAHAADPGVASLIEGLQTPGATQVDAIQLLPRYGVDALARVLPVLESADPTTSLAADDVAWAIVNLCAAPGRERDGAAATGLILAELGKGRSDGTVRRLLKYLSVGVPESADLAPLTALLEDEKWREPVRATLERIDTAEARAALIAALDPAQPGWTTAVLNALAQIGRPEEVTSQPVVALLGHGDASVRAAAVRAVGRASDPRLVRPLNAVVLKATPETAFETEDAFLRALDQLVLEGGNWQLAMKYYAKALDRASHPVLRAAAMMGLGRYGDESVAPRIVRAAVNGDTGDQEAAAMALGEIRGRGADAAIAAAYPEFPAEARPAMVAMMGKRGGAPLVPLVAEAVRSDDPALRSVAVGALAKVGSAEAVPVLAEIAASKDPDSAAAGCAALWKLADSLRAKGLIDPAGLAYGHLYVLAADQPERDRALAGLIACPSAGGFDLLLGAGGLTSFEGLPAAARVAVAGSLFRAGRTEQANAALDTLLGQPLVGADVSALIGQLGASAGEMKLGRRLGFIPQWKVVGCFPFGGPGTGLDAANVGEPEIDLGATYQTPKGDVGWIDLSADNPTGTADLMQLYGMPEKVVAYAYAEVESATERDVVLRMASDDGIKVWVNGQVVHNHDIDRGAQLDQDQAPAHLVAGKNRILVKISQGGGGWNFSLRLTTPEGVAIPQ